MLSALHQDHLWEEAAVFSSAVSLYGTWCFRACCSKTYARIHKHINTFSRHATIYSYVFHTTGDSSGWSGEFTHRWLRLAGILECLCGDKYSLCNIHVGTRNSICPKGTFVSHVIRKVWNNHNNKMELLLGKLHSTSCHCSPGGTHFGHEVVNEVEWTTPVQPPRSSPPGPAVLSSLQYNLFLDYFSEADKNRIYLNVIERLISVIKTYH